MTTHPYLAKCFAVVTYDGYGDSGQIEDVTLLWHDEYKQDRDANDLDRLMEQLIEFPFMHAVYSETKWHYHVTTPTHPVSHIIESLAEEALETHYGGWENNDGAFGGITLDFKKMSLEIKHSERYTEYHEENILLSATGEVQA